MSIYFRICSSADLVTTVANSNTDECNLLQSDFKNNSRRRVLQTVAAIITSLFIFSVLSTQSYAAEFSIVIGEYNQIVMGVSLNGNITAGDDDRLLKSVNSARARYPKLRLRAIALNSPGGAVAEALKLADRIRSLGLVTVIPDKALCASACAILFASGSIKVKSPTGLLGVHGAAVNGQQDVAALAATTYIAKVLAGLGAPASVIGRMVVTPPEAMTWLSDRDIFLFPLGYVQEIQTQSFPIILSGYDEQLEDQRRAGTPQTLSPWLNTPSLPPSERAGPILPPSQIPQPHLLPTPTHSAALLAEARQFVAGYISGVGNLQTVCAGGAAYVRGCKDGASWRHNSYYSPSPNEPTLSEWVDTWLAGYDNAYRHAEQPDWCGSRHGGDPPDDACRAAFRDLSKSGR